MKEATRKPKIPSLLLWKLATNRERCKDILKELKAVKMSTILKTTPYKIVSGEEMRIKEYKNFFHLKCLGLKTPQETGIQSAEL